ncbi:MAG: AI-2E family transporter [Candidatus Pacebacteria bacterium]|nr:AI-2E family transporter [Candidatus Paceibacterota bacterium]
MKDKLSKPFLIILLVLSLVACFLIFRPYLTEILVAAVLVSIFYSPYQRLIRLLKGRRNLAAVIMCFLLVLLIIIPVVNLVIYTGQKSVVAYQDTVEFLNQNNLSDVAKGTVFEDLNIFGLELDSLKNFVIDTLKKSSNLLFEGATVLIKGTTKFLFSLAMIILTMFFFFVDGKKMLEKIMHWSPLPNRYDLEIFRKFRAVSYTTFVSTFVTAAAQGLIGAIGFIIIGLPAFFAGILMGFLSLLPYIGSAFIYVPVGIYLLIIGDIGQGIFLLAWGAIIIGNTDNLIRGYMIKGKAQVNPIFIIFAILGGISIFGFWGVIIGPLLISIAVTILHIYELEYKKSLDRS